MWWSENSPIPDPAATRRRALLCGGLALAGLTLAGCGFAPVHGPDGAADVLRDAVAITAPETVDGYHLLTRLEDRLGTTAAPRWHLTVTLSITEETAAVGSDGTISRYNLPGVAHYRLTDIAGNTLVAEGEVRDFTGYGTGGSTVAIRAAQADARERLAVILADSITTRLIAQLSRR